MESLLWESIVVSRSIALLSGQSHRVKENTYDERTSGEGGTGAHIRQGEEHTSGKGRSTHQARGGAHIPARRAIGRAHLKMHTL